MSPAPGDASRSWLAGSVRHGFVAVIWLVTFRLLADHGVRLLPLALARELTLQSYLVMVQVVTTLLGLGVSALLLDSPRDALGVRRAAPSRLAILVGLSPAIYVAASYFAIWAALPTLIAEIQIGGRQAAQQNTGEFGRQVVEASVVSAVLWGVIVSPVAEELMFRGAVWSFVQRLVERLRDRIVAGAAAPVSGELPEGVLSDGLGLRATRRLGRFFASGGVATLATAGLFSWMHADMPGGLGIVRWVSALGLGLAAGLGRQASRSILGAIVIHVGYNLWSLATTRRWLVSEAFPQKLGVPTLLSLIAVVAAVVVLAAGLLGLSRARARPSDRVDSDRGTR